ncbi:MAG: folylpolyglutamate synthase/dihydrofolate synthase family protein [Planctomycetota bacterium]
MAQTSPAASSSRAASDGATGKPVPSKRRPLRPRRFASFQTAVRYLDERMNVERARPARLDPTMFKLDRMRDLLDRLDNPHERVKTVHIAGSKGKGSTAEMLTAGLAGCGYAVGLYTSPHLVSPRERIRINRDWIDEQDFVAALGQVAAAATAIEKKFGEATYFEMTTAMAFQYFAERAVDVAVIEVGLGGRLDSTNVITPELCIITAIQLEHTQLLGDNVQQIAREKAGILKPGVPAFTFNQGKEVLPTLKEVAEEVGAPLRVLGKDVDFSYRFEADPDLGPHVRVCVSDSTTSYEHLPVPLKGEHQAQNCGLALAALTELNQRGFSCAERPVALGLAGTQMHGRLEPALDQPRILLDGAHTPESVHAMIKAIGAHIRYDSMVMVFGCAADKDVDAMLEKVALGADKIIFTKSSSNPRACDPHELAKRFAETSTKMTQVVPDVKEAINTAARAVGRDDLIVVCGSFYLAGEAKALLEEGKAKRAEAGKPGQQVEAKA